MLFFLALTLANICICYVYNRLQATWNANDAFKWTAIVLFVFGYGGFIPGIIIGLLWGYPVNTLVIERHEDANWSLYMHICASLVWVPVVIHQFVVGKRGRRHRMLGYLGLLIWNIPMGFNITWLWNPNLVWIELAGISIPFFSLNPFSYYTKLIYFGATLNLILGIAAVRSRKLSDHKDYMMMVLLWTADPGFNRTVIHLTHVLQFVCWTCVTALEITSQRVVVNFFLTWAVLFAAKLSNRASMQLKFTAAVQCIHGCGSFLVAACLEAKVISSWPVESDSPDGEVLWYVLYPCLVLWLANVGMFWRSWIPRSPALLGATLSVEQQEPSLGEKIPYSMPSTASSTPLLKSHGYPTPSTASSTPLLSASTSPLIPPPILC